MRTTWIALSLLATLALAAGSARPRSAVATLTGIRGMVEVRPEGAAEWEAAWEAGRVLSLPQVIAQALEE